MYCFRLAQTALGVFLLSLVAFYPHSGKSDELSFGETYLEKLVVDDGFGEVTWSGTTTFEILLPWNGAVNVDEFHGGTELNFSIGEFQFSQVLDAADNYEEGLRAARFTESDTDNNGNPVNIVFVDVSWNTKTFSISGVLRNFSSAGSANFIGSVNTDVNGPIQENVSASIVFGAYTSTHNIPASGQNSVTRRVVNEEEFFLDNITFSGNAALPPNDTTKPAVSITSPTANGRITTARITGKASDNFGVAEVYCRIGNGEFFLAEGTTNWFADVTLEPGTNTVSVYSVDLRGNESSVVNRTFFYVVTSPVLIEIFGQGTTTITNGQLLELGRSYTITAKPAVSNLFLEWLGDVNSTSPTISFFMHPEAQLQAQFVPNQFIQVQGNYSGLFTNEAGVDPASAGFLTLAVKDSGAFSGAILLGGARHPVTGVFNSSGQASKTILRRGKPGLDLQLQLDFAGRLAGTISQGGTNSILDAELAQSSTDSVKRKYTLLIPPALDPSTMPGGYGFGGANLDLKGKLQFRGVMGEGTIVNQATTISMSQRWPFYASLYRGKGVALGWLIFSDEAETDLSGEITWTKIARANGKFYTNGFAPISGEAIGSEFIAPPRGTPVLNWSNGFIELNGGNLAASLTNGLVIATNKIRINSPNQMSLNIASPSGLLNGRFVNPDTRKASLLKGAVLQKPQWGAGFFLGTNQSGYFELQPSTVE